MKEIIEQKQAESKHDKFIRLATARTNKALNAISKIRNCAARASYEYSEAEIEYIFRTLESALTVCKAEFKPKQKPETEAFSLLNLTEQSEA